MLMHLGICNRLIPKSYTTAPPLVYHWNKPLLYSHQSKTEALAFFFLLFAVRDLT